MKVNSDIGLLPPDPASFLSTSPIHQTIMNIILVYIKMAFLSALPIYLLTYVYLLSNTTLNRSRYTLA